MPDAGAPPLATHRVAWRKLHRIRLQEGRDPVFIAWRRRADGNKQSVAMNDGCGESAASWKEILIACLTMVFKLVQFAKKHWRALNGSSLIPEIIVGVQVVDGLKKDAA